MKPKRGQRRLFDEDGRPTGKGWGEMLYPDLADANAYALEVEGKLLAPFYRAGDRLVVSPAAKVRRGARVFVRCKKGGALCRVYLGKGSDGVRFARLSGEPGPTIPANEIETMHQIFAVIYR